MFYTWVAYDARYPSNPDEAFALECWCSQEDTEQDVMKKVTEMSYGEWWLVRYEQHGKELKNDLLVAHGQDKKILERF